MTLSATGRRETRDGVDHLALDRDFPLPVEEVWAAVTDPERLSRWIGTWTGDPARGTVDFRMTAEGEDVPVETYVIEVCDPPRRLVTRTQAPDGAEPDWVLTVDLVDHDGGTRLTFAQAMADAEMAASLCPGWEYYLDRLVAAERGEDVEAIDFEAYLADQQDHYRALFA
ncbi:SRPBCC domain-containing protein [Mumia zhuanghuii]|uniref:Polyketide cyclase n=2 Tax=Mumia zhuanghuii TaxID=2585211 RepID=A0A5C4N435_9ACTN|nr:SRPBCC domain-containing protein [Mumia zhuanghuii]TNC51776.1 polyketide cyclase [Mumia zhuanghuii]